jgi:hypothetical protein
MGSDDVLTSLAGHTKRLWMDVGRLIHAPASLSLLPASKKTKAATELETAEGPRKKGL